MTLKRKIYLLCLWLSCCNSLLLAQNVEVQDTALNRAILEKVLFRDYHYGWIVINQTASNDMIQSYNEPITRYRNFYNKLSTDFKLGEKTLVDILQQNNYKIDLSAISSRIKLADPPKNGKWIQYYDSLQHKFQRPIITSTTILLNDQKDLCLVFFHAFMSGGTTAILMKKQGLWELSSYGAEWFE